MPRVRLDQLLVDRGLAPSRAAAQAMVLAGEVELAAGRSLKPGNLVAPNAAVIVRDRPRWASRAGDKLEAALDAFEVDNGSYPRGKNGLQELVQQPRNSQNWKGPYLKGEIPVDPWGNPYVFESPGKHNPSSYDILSMGPDGRVGGDDDIANWESKR